MTERASTTVQSRLMVMSFLTIQLFTNIEASLILKDDAGALIPICGGYMARTPGLPRPFRPEPRPTAFTHNRKFVIFQDIIKV
jgi:hypothetical protein